MQCQPAVCGHSDGGISIPGIPCEMRLEELPIAPYLWPFQSPHPLRNATEVLDPLRDAEGISIPASLAGCDLRASRRAGVRPLISIPASLRDATSSCRPRRSTSPYFNPHIPTGCDPRRCGVVAMQGISIPASPTGCDRNNYCMNPPRPTTSRTKREPQPSHRAKAAPQQPDHGANHAREVCSPRVRAPKRSAPGRSAGRARASQRIRFTPPASSASTARSISRRTPRTSTGSSRCSRCASS